MGAGKKRQAPLSSHEMERASGNWESREMSVRGLIVKISARAEKSAKIRKEADAQKRRRAYSAFKEECHVH